MLGLFYLREPAFDTAKAAGPQKPFPVIPPAIVRRAVAVLLTIAAVSGLIFNAFTLLLPKLMEERLASSPDLLPVVGLLAFLGDALRRADPVHRRQPDRPADPEVDLPAARSGAGAGAGAAVRRARAGWCCRSRR